MDINPNSIDYTVTATDEIGESYSRAYSFVNKPYPHSSHLTSIMEYLDDEGLTLVSITVV